MVLWVEFDQKVNTIELYDLAIKKGISIAPGGLFTLQNQFANCMRLNYGMPWNGQLDQGLKNLADIAIQLNR